MKAEKKSTLSPICFTPSPAIDKSPNRTGHRPRASVINALKLQLTSSLFNGGALDSQVTDSQYIRQISGEVDSQLQVPVDLPESIEYQDIQVYSDDDYDGRFSQKHQLHAWPENANNTPLALSPPPPKSPLMISWPISQDEKDILESVRAAKSHQLNKLECEIAELEKESQRLRAECRKLWLWIRELATTLQDNKINVPILMAA